jgi:CubicO group peptidase (beta-lactamase class C family)
MSRALPGHRAFPGHPSLRFLKIEAKRRLAAGEFDSLHAAQQAIAAEFGQSTWAALKAAAEEAAAGPAMDQLGWLIERFAEAGRPGWTPPSDDELGAHFSDRMRKEPLVESIRPAVPQMSRPLTVLSHSTTSVAVALGDLLVEVEVEPDAPHLITALGAIPRPRPAADPRTAGAPPRRTTGDAPAAMRELAAELYPSAGAPALVLAGPEWTIATGWADLDRDEAVDPGVRLPVPGVSGLVIATAILRLVADGRLSLDEPVNDHLRSLRLAAGGVTVRELLTHTGGVDNPTPLYGDHVPPLTDLLGPVGAETGRRGELQPSNGGFAVLAQLVADVTGEPFEAAAARLVLDPLGVRSAVWSSTPTGITGYELDSAGRFTPVPRQVCTVPAVGGLQITAADLIRLGLGWPTLLPDDLAGAALTAQTTGAGLGWLLTPRGDVALHAGVGAGFSAALFLRTADRSPLVVVASMVTPLGTILEPLLPTWAGNVPG